MSLKLNNFLELFVLIKYFFFSILGLLDLAHQKNLVQATECITLNLVTR